MGRNRGSKNGFLSQDIQHLREDRMDGEEKMQAQGKLL